MTSNNKSECPLCVAREERVLWRDRRCRIVLVADNDYPAFCRVIWNAHVREMTDLTKSQRAHFLTVVYAVEQTLRGLMQPEKINLASLGNQVPHLHWHVIPRFNDDAHFPDPIWAAKKRPGNPHGVDQDQLTQHVRARLGVRQPRPR
jgi:diadenosine tetraphosphate (Ap4A) HIT family hydrolase